jgi:hypothetical protein
LCVIFNHSKGIYSTLKLIKKAAEGTYHLKGFNEENNLQALLFLWLRGACVANIAHHIFGTPSVLVVCTHTTIPQILPSPAFPTHFEIEQNIAACFEEILDILRTSGLCAHAVLIFDKLAVEKQPQWDNKSNKVLGVCCKHGEGTSLQFISEDNLDMLWEELKSEKIHLAHEVSIYISCSSLLLSYCIHQSHLSNTHVFAIIGDCWYACSPKFFSMTIQHMPNPCL